MFYYFFPFFFISQSIGFVERINVSMHIDKKQLGLDEEWLVLTKCDYMESTIKNDESEIENDESEVENWELNEGWTEE